MAAPTNTFLSTAAIGNREDLINTIFRISPTTTPVLSMSAKTKASATLHEWQTQDLAAAASNAQAEGDTLTAKVVTPTVRLNNKTQIASKAVVVSGTQQAVNTAGRKDEMGYQLSLVALECKRDMEFGLCQNNVTATAPRLSRGLLGWSGDNADSGVGYVAPVYTANPGTVQTDGTQTTFTETRLKNMLQKVFTAGGNPDTLLLPPIAKQTFSSFTGNSTRFKKAEDQKLNAAVEVYVSDFGDLKAIPDRFMRVREVFALQSDKIAVAYLRPFQTIELATTGDAQQRQLVVEYCMEMRAPKAHGVVADIL
jgi:hypothetical protein